MLAIDLYLQKFLTHSKIEIMLLSVLIICVLTFLSFKFFIARKDPCNVYLIDFTCYKPPSSQKYPKEQFMKNARKSGFFSESLVDFMERILDRGGLGDETYLAEIFFGKSYNPSLEASRREVDTIVFSSIDMLLTKTRIKCEDIGILIVNCCIYNPEPSLTSIIVNRYKLRENIITYNLVGMGCSAGLLAIGLAKNLLKVNQNTCALIVSTDSMTENFYYGKNHSMFIVNCLFRLGGAAILLSNRQSDHHISKYQLLHAVHTSTSNSDRSYNCIQREEDDCGKIGISVTKHLVASAIDTIKPNITALGSMILPKKEKLLYILIYVVRKLLPSLNIQPYMPNYGKAVDHFLPHVGGRMILDGLQKSLGFSDTEMEASRMTLYRYGNTSSSSVWYELAYVEAKGRMKKGNQLWQIAFGSGFKCSSVIWRAMKTVEYGDVNNPWTDEISRFPVILDNNDEPMPMY